MRKYIIFTFSIFVLLIFSFNAYLYVKQPAMVFYPLKEIEATPKDWDLPYESLKLKATVVTGDPEFEKLSHEVTIYWVT